MMLEGFVLLLLQGTGAFVIRSPVPSPCLGASSGKERLRLRPCDLDSDPPLAAVHLLVRRGMEQPLTTEPPGPCIYDPKTHGKQRSSPRICLDSALPLASDSRDVTLPSGKLLLWEAKLRKENQRYRRAFDNGDDSEGESGDADESDPTEEQREYLRWYYRTEDPSSWKYAMLALSFVALLLGSLLFGLGIMADRSRKAIAMYKPAIQLLEMEKLDSGTQKRGTSDASPQGDWATVTALVNRDEVDRMKPGDIVLKWKDGNVSVL
nr:organic solute transporter subunit beta [Paramormyrops kingsleyae]